MNWRKGGCTGDKMKVINTGVEYDIYPDDLKCYNKIPAGFYMIRYNPCKGFCLEKYPEFAITDEKIYGIHVQKADKVLNSFEISNRNLGVILCGDKGIGKSLFARLLGKKAVKYGIPVIIVDKYIENVSSFIDRIDQEIMLLFDEFDKTYAVKQYEYHEEDPKNTLLSLFDGVSPGKKLFVVTCNKLRDLNEFMVNRPGRFHYRIRFDYPDARDIQEYLSDTLREEFRSEIDSVVQFANRVHLNYDCLRSIVFELNQGLSFLDAINDLNIVNMEEGLYWLRVKLQTAESDNNEFFPHRYINAWLDSEEFYMNPFSVDEIKVELHKSNSSDYAGYIRFLPIKMKAETEGSLYIDAADVTIDYEIHNEDDEEKWNYLRALTIENVIIHCIREG